VSTYPVLVVGLGNELRGDDGLGLAIARRLREQAGLEVRELSGEPVDLLEGWLGFDAVVLVDAMRSGARSGEIVRFDAGNTPLPETLRGCASTHAIGLAETIELGRALDRLPSQLIVYGVEGRRFNPGDPISDELVEIIPELAERVAAEARRALGALG
jgi:hydrogenase maturation protease